MGLTQEQISFEKDWAVRYAEARASMEFESVRPFLKCMFREPRTANTYFTATSRTASRSGMGLRIHVDSTHLIRPGGVSLAGISAIEQAHGALKKVVSGWKHSELVTLVDEDNGRLVTTCKSTASLNGDPEQQALALSNVIIVHKRLGVNEEQFDSEETISDPTPLFKRMTEIGINPANLMK